MIESQCMQNSDTISQSMVAAGVQIDGDVVDQSICGKLKSPHHITGWLFETAEYTEECKTSRTDKGARGHR